MAEGLLGNLLTVLLQYVPAPGSSLLHSAKALFFSILTCFGFSTTRPSSSIDTDLHPSFHEAERHGHRGADCALRYSDCAVSLLGLLTEHPE